MEKVPQDYTIFEPAGFTAGCYLYLTESYFFPINTYKNFEKDPLATITNALSKIAPEEGAAVQIIIKPSRIKLKKRGDKALAKIREGKPVKTAIAEASRSLIADILIEIINVFKPQTIKGKEGLTSQDARMTQLRIDENLLKTTQHLLVLL